MEYKNIKGIIVRETKYKEADKIFTVVTDSLGKINVIAKGASKLTSKNSSISPLTLFEIDIKKTGENLYILTSHTRVLDFYEITKELETHCYVNYILNLANDLFLEDDPFPELFKLLANTIFLYSKNSKNKELIKCIFELRALTISGYALDIEECQSCGNVELMYINLYEGAAFCKDCASSDTAKKVSPTVFSALNYITFSDDKKLFAFSLGNDYIRELSFITTNYIKICLEKEYSSLKYLRTIQKGMKNNA